MLRFAVNFCANRIEIDPRRLCADAPGDGVIALALGFFDVIVFVFFVDDLLDAVEHESVVVIAVALHIFDVEIYERDSRLTVKLKPGTHPDLLLGKFKHLEWTWTRLKSIFTRAASYAA